MTIYVSVVSHEHESIIEELACLPQLNAHPAIKVVLKNNVKSSHEKLIKYCSDNGVILLDNCDSRGFGYNNNVVFDYCRSSLGMVDGDLFVILNPDLYISVEDLLLLHDLMLSTNVNLASVNLYKNFEKSAYDYNVRRYPTLLSFIRSFLNFPDDMKIDKSLINQPVSVDWAAGSFLAFSAGLYRRLSGFDARYFMYCEDIDICWRANRAFNTKLIYYPNIEAVHFARFNNRTLFSKHFIWHVKSIFRYLKKTRSFY